MCKMAITSIGLNQPMGHMQWIGRSHFTSARCQCHGATVLYADVFRLLSFDDLQKLSWLSAVDLDRLNDHPVVIGLHDPQVDGGSPGLSADLGTLRCT